MKSLEQFQLINAKSASAILGVTERTLYRYCEEGLKHFRIKGMYRFKMEDILSFKEKS
jgi:predicted site-specific integrase-resolvase